MVMMVNKTAAPAVMQNINDMNISSESWRGLRNLMKAFHSRSDYTVVKTLVTVGQNQLFQKIKVFLNFDFSNGVKKSGQSGQSGHSFQSYGFFQ